MDSYHQAVCYHTKRNLFHLSGVYGVFLHQHSNFHIVYHRTKHIGLSYLNYVRVFCVGFLSKLRIVCYHNIYIETFCILSKTKIMSKLYQNNQDIFWSVKKVYNSTLNMNIQLFKAISKIKTKIF